MRLRGALRSARAFQTLIFPAAAPTSGSNPTPAPRTKFCLSIESGAAARRESFPPNKKAPPQAMRRGEASCVPGPTNGREAGQTRGSNYGRTLNKAASNGSSERMKERAEIARKPLNIKVHFRPEPGCSRNPHLREATHCLKPWSSCNDRAFVLPESTIGSNPRFWFCFSTY